MVPNDTPRAAGGFGPALVTAGNLRSLKSAIPRLGESEFIRVLSVPLFLWPERCRPVHEPVGATDLHGHH